MKFFEFRQNNSGGFFDENDDVAAHVIIEAETEKEAIEKFKPLIENQSYSCPCCGDRWYISPDEVIFGERQVNVYTDGNYTEKWNEKYGLFKRNKEPKKFKKHLFEEYGTSILIETIEDYAFYLKQSNIISKSSIVHYANGNKLKT